MSGRQCSVVFLALLLPACASRIPAPVVESKPPVRVEPSRPSPAPATTAIPVSRFYTVKRGDTLFSIALDHGIDYRDLAAWNNIENINRIRIGQQLRLTAPGGYGTDSSSVRESADTEVRPIATGSPVVARPLGGSPETAPVAVPSAPTVATTDSETLKRAPKGGKLPYSEENLSRLRSQGAAVAIVAPAPVAPATEKPPGTDKPVSASQTATEGEVEWAWPAAGKLLAGFAEGAGGQEASKGIDIAGRLGDPISAAAGGKVVYVGSGLRGYGNLVIVRHNSQFLSAYAHNSRILVKEGQQVSRGQKIAELGNSDADQPKLHFEVRQQGKPVDPLKFLPAR